MRKFENHFFISILKLSTLIARIVNNNVKDDINAYFISVKWTQNICYESNISCNSVRCGNVLIYSRHGAADTVHGKHPSSITQLWNNSTFMKWFVVAHTSYNIRNVHSFRIVVLGCTAFASCIESNIDWHAISIYDYSLWSMWFGWNTKIPRLILQTASRIRVTHHCLAVYKL